MKTEQALREFIDSRISANLSPATIEWYETKRLLVQVAAMSPDDNVFHGHKGPITRHLIYAIVRRHMEKVGIKGPKLGPHRIRHAFGKNYLVKGSDLRSLQEIMGYADVKTTEKYSTLNLADIVKKHRKFSPEFLWLSYRPLVDIENLLQRPISRLKRQR